MSKYKKGDRFIIEIGEVFGNEPVSIYKAEGTNTLYLNDAQLAELQVAITHEDNKDNVMESEEE